MSNDTWREPARACRIRQRDRMRRRAFRHASLTFLFWDPLRPGDYAWTDRLGRTRHGVPDREHRTERCWVQAVRQGNNRTPCSCAGCGNQRRHFGDITMQERRFHEAARNQLQEEGIVHVTRQRLRHR